MVNIGLVGLGFMGLTHLRSYRLLSDARVVAIADIDPRRAHGDLSGVWGNLGPDAPSQWPMEGIVGTRDYRAVLEMPEVDLVDICVPTWLHAQIAVEALAAGKHVLCEKPLALTSQDASRVAAAAERSRGFFMPAHCIRFWPEWAWARQALERNLYGKVLSASFERLCTMPGADWYARGELSGGAIFDLHIHDTDFVCQLFGRPTAVSSRGYTKTSGRIDHVLTHYIYDDVPIVSAQGGWSFADGFGFSMRYRINFAHATAEYDSGRPTPLILYQDGRAQPVSCHRSDGYVEELRYFLASIQAKTPPEVVTAADAVSAIQVIEAEQKSVTCQGAVTSVGMECATPLHGAPRHRRLRRPNSMFSQ